MNNLIAGLGLGALAASMGAMNKEKADQIAEEQSGNVADSIRPLLRGMYLSSDPEEQYNFASHLYTRLMNESKRYSRYADTLKMTNRPQSLTWRTVFENWTS